MQDITYKHVHTRRGRGRGGRGSRKIVVGSNEDIPVDYNMKLQLFDSNQQNWDGKLKFQMIINYRIRIREHAAKVIQQLAREYISRQRLVELILAVYVKQYNPIEKKFLYINKRTLESSYDRPRIFDRVLKKHVDVFYKKEPFTTKTAAICIQKMIRNKLAKNHIKRKAHDTYRKLFNPLTKKYYFLNVHTGFKSDFPPKILRGPGNELEVETFQYTKPICKITSKTNDCGSGIIGFFCGVLCLLADGATLPNAEIAQDAHIVCNYSDISVPTEILLSTETLFLPIACHRLVKNSIKDYSSIYTSSNSPSTQQQQPDFIMCAVNQKHFDILAGRNVQPINFELNDSYMACVDSSGFRCGDLIEIIGHPHGKLLTTNVRTIKKMIPNTIEPKQLEYDSYMESGAGGCPVFTIGGRLLGMQHYVSLKDKPPITCWYIKSILDIAVFDITPPQPSIILASLTSHTASIAWVFSRPHKISKSTTISFEVELCCHSKKNGTLAKGYKHESFNLVYRGPATFCSLGNLESDTLHSIRCRAINSMKKSKWSFPFRFHTPVKLSQSWKVKYCQSVCEAIKLLKKNRNKDIQLYSSILQWLLAWRPDHALQKQHTTLDYKTTELYKYDPADLRALELEVSSCGGFELIVDSFSWYPVGDNKVYENTLCCIYLLSKFVSSGSQIVINLAAKGQTIEYLFKIISVFYTTNYPRCKNNPQNLLGGDGQGRELEMGAQMENVDARLPSATLRLLCILFQKSNSSKLNSIVCSGIPVLISVMARDFQMFREYIMLECCQVLQFFSNEYEDGAQHLIEKQGLNILRDVLLDYENNHRIAYHSLVTIGNISRSCQLHRANNFIPHDLVQAICNCNVNYGTKAQELKSNYLKAAAEVATLRKRDEAHEIRNEIDAAVDLATTLSQVCANFQVYDVNAAAQFALQYILTDEQKKVQITSKSIMTRFLTRKLDMAMKKWIEVTIYERERSIIEKFILVIRRRHLLDAYRQWDISLKRFNYPKSWIQCLGSALALNLNKHKKEKYRLLVFQK